MTTRDRHARGPRGPLFPGEIGGRDSRRGRFDLAVADAASRIEADWGDEWGHLVIDIEDLPPPLAPDWADGVPLGALIPASGGAPARIVVYRRPIEHRAATPRDLVAIVRDVLADRVADLLGRSPEEIDPDYGT